MAERNRSSHIQKNLELEKRIGNKGVRKEGCRGEGYFRKNNENEGVLVLRRKEEVQNVKDVV